MPSGRRDARALPCCPRHAVTCRLLAVARPELRTAFLTKPTIGVGPAPAVGPILVDGVRSGAVRAPWDPARIGNAGDCRRRAHQSRAAAAAGQRRGDVDRHTVSSGAERRAAAGQRRGEETLQRDETAEGDDDAADTEADEPADLEQARANRADLRQLGASGLHPSPPTRAVTSGRWRETEGGEHLW